MLQAILVSPGKIELRETPIPEPKEGEVLIKVSTALTCGTDLKAFLRGHPLIPMPGPFGHEYSGIIVKTGKEVKNFKEGDPVMGVNSAPCHRCLYCMKGLYNLCERLMEEKVLGTYSEYLLIPAHIVKENLFLKPENISFTEAAILEPLSCVIHPYNKIDLQDIEHALIIGAGPIGLLHLAFLNLHKIEVTVLDKNRKRLSIASEMGAKVTSTPEGIGEIIQKYTGSLGYDLVVECTGQVEVWQESVNLVRKGGRVILFGGCKPGTTVVYQTKRLHYDEITLLGSFHFTPKDVRKAAELITDKRLDLQKLITSQYSLKDIKKAFELLSRGEGIKFAILP
jgi:L-iditol 2-dehydrogenase